MSQKMFLVEHTIFWYVSQMPLINDHASISSKPRGLHFCLSIYLHPYFVYVSGECSSESAHTMPYAQTRLTLHCSLIRYVLKISRSLYIHTSMDPWHLLAVSEDCGLLDLSQS